MKDILFITIRVEVNSSLTEISETIKEIEEKGVVIISDTPNVQVLSAEILLTRYRNLNK